MLLMNGSRGIGTGYSTYVPPCNPVVIKKMLQDWLKGDKEALNTPLTPYFQGFKGTIVGEVISGVYRKDKDAFVVIELPAGTWTADYREWLEKMLVEGKVKDFTDISTDTEVNIRITGIAEELLVKSLSDKVKTTNMHAFNAKGIITKYDSLNDILREYAGVRLELYEKRRLHQIKEMKDELPFHENIVRFIKSQCEEKPVPDLKRKPMAECVELLEKNKYDRIHGDYNYIMKLPVSSFTAENIEKHEKDMMGLRKSIHGLENKNANELWLNDLQCL
jgi:DNA topoisomerase-2